jgi:hypothetical protein
VTVIYRATIKGHYDDGTLVVPSLHYRTIPPGGGDEPDANDVAHGIWDVLGDAYLSCLDPSMHVDELVVTEEVLGTDIPHGGSWVVDADGGAGAAGGDLMPKALTMVLVKRTDIHIRSARGWMLLAFQPAHSNVDGDVWVDSAITTGQTLGTAMEEEFTLGTFLDTLVAPIIYSRKRHVAGDANYFFTIQSVIPRPKVSWLRSRTTSP